MQTLKSQTVLFFVIMLIVTIAFFYLILPFIYAVFWAIILGGLFMPVYKKVEKKLHKPHSARRLFLF